MIAEPAAEVGGTGVENIVQGVKGDGQGSGARHPVSWREHAGGVEDQQRVGEIARAEDAHTEEEAAKISR